MKVKSLKEQIKKFLEKNTQNFEQNIRLLKVILTRKLQNKSYFEQKILIVKVVKDIKAHRKT